MGAYLHGMVFPTWQIVWSNMYTNHSLPLLILIKKDNVISITLWSVYIVLYQ